VKLRALRQRRRGRIEIIPMMGFLALPRQPANKTSIPRPWTSKSSSCP
jgi:hypothetical protein